MQPQAGTVGLMVIYEVQDSTGAARDISSFTTTELIFKQPDGAVVTKAATFQTDGTDGKLTYETVAGDLALAGSWRVQAHLANVSYDEFTEVSLFHLSKNLED